MRRAIATVLAFAATVAAAQPPRKTWYPPDPVVKPAWLAPMQYLYGSGEAAAITAASWGALVGFVEGVVKQRPKDSVVLLPGATLEKPAFEPCRPGEKLAVVLDIDETALLNTGYEYDDAAHGGLSYDPARWDRWERQGAAVVAATPGAVAAVARLRVLDVAVIFNSNRLTANASSTTAALRGAGLVAAGETPILFLAADTKDTDKDARRGRIAADHCVVAMAGDQLGDFSDLFNRTRDMAARRASVSSPALARLWGAGWFVMPNPVYGSALHGGLGELFPPARQWTDPGPDPAAAPATVEETK